MTWRQRLWAFQHRNSPYLFIAPFVILFAVFMLYPLVRSMILSFHQTSGGPGTLRYVGLGNYSFLIKDGLFWLAVLNTFGYTFLFVVVQIPMSLGLAVLLNSPRVLGRNIFRFAFFSPYLVGHVFVAVIFTLLLARNGPLNQVLKPILSTSELNWMSDPVLGRFAVIIAATWLSIGYGMVYFLAALQGVDKELYEAAEVDGAGKWSQFWHVTLPGIKPVLVFMILIGTIGGLQLFELPYVLFQGPGPGQAGLTIVLYLFTYGFEFGDIGYASALGWMLALMILVVALIQMRVVGGKAEAP